MKYKAIIAGVALIIGSIAGCTVSQYRGTATSETYATAVEGVKQGYDMIKNAGNAEPSETSEGASATANQ